MHLSVDEMIDQFVLDDDGHSSTDEAESIYKTIDDMNLSVDDIIKQFAVVVDDVDQNDNQNACIHNELESIESDEANNMSSSSSLYCSPSKGSLKSNKIKTETHEKKFNIERELNSSSRADDHALNKFWTVDQCLFLVYGYQATGSCSWIKVMKMFGSRLNRRPSHVKTYPKFLAKKYLHLKQRNELQHYEELIRMHSSLIGDIFEKQEWMNCVVNKLANMDDNTRKIVDKILEDKTQKKTYTTWGEDECLTLVYGIQVFGVGNWSKVLKMFNDRFSGCTTKFLTEKYNRMQKSGELKHYESLIAKYSDLISNMLMENSSQNESIIGKIASMSSESTNEKLLLHNNDKSGCDWTDEKSCFLLYGVKFYGSNDWQSIARYYRSVLDNCEPQELKAKYQLLKLTNQLDIHQKAIEHHLYQTLEMVIKVEKT